MTFSYTYWMRDIKSGLVKIGRTSSIHDRLRTLGGPKKIECIKIIHGDIESELHEFYHEFRRFGEWFNLPDSITDRLVAIPEKDFPGTKPKPIKIFNKVHRALKIESAKAGMPIAAFSSSLIGFALDQVKSGKLTISKLDEADKRRTSRK